MEERRKIENKAESLTVQEQLNEFLLKRLNEPYLHSEAIKIVKSTQEKSLHLEHPITKVKTPIDVSLVPVVITPEIEEGMYDYIQVTNIVRAAVLLQMEERSDLRAFLEAGVDPLAREIMAKNPFKLQKNQYRYRSDTATNQITGQIKSVENNGGEPQGDAIISDAISINEQVIALCLDEDSNKAAKRLYPRPDRFMMEVLISRYQEATGKDDVPTIGYFAWEGKSSLSRAEAKYTAERYQEMFGGQAIAFEPFDIVDIRENQKEDGQNYYTIVCHDKENNTHEIEIVRRLLGEPMENLDLWKKFKDTNGKKMCSDNKETIWERFTSKLGNQMINPLNSYATDKKLDVILGNPSYMEHFGIWEKVDEILASDDMSDLASIDTEIRMLGTHYIQNQLQEYMPYAIMVRRVSDGLYNGDQNTNYLGLNDLQIASIKEGRQHWVLKRYSLEGHSGTSVYVGSNINLAELEYKDYILLPDKSFEEITGMTKEEFENTWTNGVITTDSLVGRYMTLVDQTKSPEQNAQIIIRRLISDRQKEFDTDELSKYQDEAWEVLVENSLNTEDSLLQQTIEQHDVPVLVLNNSGLFSGKMHYDLDPQSIGTGRFTHPVIRVTSAPKTNITGGYGALGVAISESRAKEILRVAKEKGILAL